MLALLCLLGLLADFLVLAKHSGDAAITHAFDICDMKDSKACSTHGTCTSYLRSDKKPATRCQCNYPYVGDTCAKKRFQAVKKPLKEESSSSSSSSETSDSDSSSESSDSDESELSSSSSESESSESSDSDGSWEDHSDHRHHEHSEWTSWVFGLIFLVFICMCIGGLFWFMWRPTRVVKISGRA